MNYDFKVDSFGVNDPRNRYAIKKKKIFDSQTVKNKKVGRL